MNSKLITSVIGIAVAIIILASVLVPVISDARENAGEEITFNNRTPGGNQLPETHMSELKDSDLLIIRTNGDSTHTVTINGEEYLQEDYSASINWIMSDGIFISQNNTGAQYNIYMTGSTTRVISNSVGSQITMSGGVITLVSGSTTLTGSYTWAFYFDPEGEYVEVMGNRGSTLPYYVNSTHQIVCSGVYTTGENDCFYSMKDGIIKIDQDYTTGISTPYFSKETNSTDVYSGAITLDIGAESFQPYVVLVPNSVKGHEASGGAYNLYGVIPVFVIVLILLSAITLIRNKDA